MCRISAGTRKNHYKALQRVSEKVCVILNLTQAYKTKQRSQVQEEYICSERR